MERSEKKKKSSLPVISATVRPAPVSCTHVSCGGGSRQAALSVPQTLLFPPQTCKHAPIWSVAQTIYLDFGLIFSFFCCHFPYAIRTTFPSAGFGAAVYVDASSSSGPPGRAARGRPPTSWFKPTGRMEARACRARAKPNPKTRKVIGRLAGAARSRWGRV